MKEKSRALILLSWMHDLLLFEGIYVLAIAIWNIRGREAFSARTRGSVIYRGVQMPESLDLPCVFFCHDMWDTYGNRESHNELAHYSCLPVPFLREDEARRNPPDDERDA